MAFIYLNSRHFLLNRLLHFLSHHPDVQDKIVNELETVLEHGQKELDGNLIKKLK